MVHLLEYYVAIGVLICVVDCLMVINMINAMEDSGLKLSKRVFIKNVVSTLLTVLIWPFSIVRWIMTVRFAFKKYSIVELSSGSAESQVLQDMYDRGEAEEL